MYTQNSYSMYMQLLGMTMYIHNVHDTIPHYMLDMVKSCMHRCSPAVFCFSVRNMDKSLQWHECLLFSLWTQCCGQCLCMIRCQKMYHIIYTFQVLIAQSSWLYPTCVCIDPLPNSVLSSRKRPAEIAIISGIRYAEVNCKKLQDGCASDWGT